MELVHVDPDFVVVHKPSGLLAIPGRHEPDSVVTRVRALYPEATGTLMVHRLDMDTSGLMIVSLSREAQRALAIQFEHHVVEKLYVALLGGEVVGEGGTVRLASRLDPADRPRQVIDPVHGRLGETVWEVESRPRPGVTRVRLRPRTGRTHQLRLHAAYGLGAPILGDRLYGDPSTATRLMLHAECLALSHPRTGTPIVFRAASPF